MSKYVTRSGGYDDTFYDAFDEFQSGSLREAWWKKTIDILNTVHPNNEVYLILIQKQKKVLFTASKLRFIPVGIRDFWEGL